MQPHKKIFWGARVRDVRSGREGMIEDIDEVSGLVEVVFDPVAAMRTVFAMQIR